MKIKIKNFEKIMEELNNEHIKQKENEIIAKHKFTREMEECDNLIEEADQLFKKELLK